MSIDLGIKPGFIRAREFAKKFGVRYQALFDYKAQLEKAGALVHGPQESLYT
jgi:hypothetical protein